MIESGGDGAERSHASEFPPAPGGGSETGDAGVGTGGAGLVGDLSGGPGDGEEARVRSCLAPLDRLATLPVREHVAVFEQVFSGLETTLATVAGEGRAEAAAPSAVRKGEGHAAVGGGEAGSTIGRGAAGSAGGAVGS